VQFLIEHVNILGVEIQYWMLLVVALVAGFAIYGWNTRDRT